VQAAKQLMRDHLRWVALQYRSVWGTAGTR
jgi:hypothetical protein